MKIKKFLFEKGVIKQKDGKISSNRIQNFITLSDLEIVIAFNAEIRGICNYYNLSVNFHKLIYFAYLMEYSCLKTLASKHDTSVAKIRKNIKWEVEDGQFLMVLKVERNFFTL